MTETLTPTTSAALAENKAAIIKKISAALVQRREARGLTIEKVYDATKIRPQTIRALESGNWNDLPGEVYVRGFLTRYAQFLGMNPQEILNSYFELTQAPPQRAPEHVSQPIPDAEPNRLPWIWGGVGLLFFIAIIKFVGSHIGNSKSAPAAPAASPVENVVAVSTPAAVAAAPVIPVRNKHRFVLFSPNEVWLNITSESKRFEGTIPASTTWTFVGEGNFSIRLGHTKDIHASFDDRPLNVTESQKRTYQINDH